MMRKIPNSMRLAAFVAGIGILVLSGASALLAAGGSGSATISPSAGVAAGHSGTWIIRYTAAEAFSSGTIGLAIPDGWSAPQISSSSSPGYVTVSSEGTLGAPALAIALGTISVFVDTLELGQTIEIVFGDTTVDAGGRATAQTGVESGVQFGVSSNPDGAGGASIAASPTLDVVAGPVAKLSFMTPPRTFSADGESPAIRVRTEDEFGNASAVSVDQDISLISTAPSGRFSHLGGSSFVETGTVVIAAGLDTVSLHYRDTLAGEKTITVSASGQLWSSAQQSITVDPGPPFRLVVSPSDTTAVAGDFVRYRLGVEDAAGNASPLPNDQAITLFGQPGAFYSTANHTTPIATIVISNGSDHVYLDYRNTNKDMTIPVVLAFLDANGDSPTLEAASAFIYIDNAPLSAAASEISVDKASAVANAIDSIEIAVRARDVYYNGVGGATVLIASTGSGNLLHQPAGVTSETGSAVGSIRSTKAEGKTLTAKVDGVDIVASAGATFTPGLFDPTVSDVSVDKTSAVANGIDSVAVTAFVSDAGGNPIAGSFVTLEATGTFNTITPSSGLTGSDGRLVGKMRSTRAELKTVSAKVGGTPITQTRNVTFNAGPFSASASNVSVDKATSVANGVDSVTVTALVTDASGNPIAGSSVTIEATGTLNTITPSSGLTGSDGRLVGKMRSTKAELKTVSAKVGGTPITQTRNVTFNAGPFSAAASNVTVDKATAVADGVDSIAVTALVTDAQGNPIAGSFVTLEATGTFNTITPSSGVTGSDGRLVGKMRSTNAEPKTISARVGATPITQTRNVTFGAGPFSAGVSTLTVNKTTVTADGVDAVTVTATVKDAQGNPISGSSVTIESTGAANNITQPVGPTGLDGVAVGTVKSTKAEPKTISARGGATPITQTRNVTFAAGAFSAAASDVQVDKVSATADGVDAISVTVYARDAQGNGIAGKTVAIAATGGGNVLTQPGGPTDANGRAIGTLKSTAAEGKTISAKVEGADITKTVPVTFGAGALHHFNVTHGGAATAGVASFVTIDARDSQNNRIADFAGIAKVYTSSTVPGDFIAWGLGNASGSILSEVGDTVRYQFVPADLGDAELGITDNKVESITIYASSGSVTSSSAAPLVVGHAAPDRMLLVSGNNQRAVVNQEVAASLVVRVEDAFGNAVPGVTVSWAITKGGGYFDASRTLGGQQTTSVTASDGTTSGELWRLGTVSGLNSDAIAASMPSGSIRTVSFVATTDHAAISSIVLTPTSKSVTVSSPTIVTATMRDVFGNFIPDEYVTIFINDTPDGTLSAAAGSATDPQGPYARRGKSDSTGTVSVTYNAPASAGIADVLDANSNTIPAGSVADVAYTTVASGATDLAATVLTGQISRAGATFSFRVEAVDGNGNRDLTNASRIVLEPPVGGGFTFSLTDFGAPITEADLASGAVTLYGRGSKTGTWQIPVRDKVSALSPDQFGITIATNDTVSSYVVVAPPAATAGTDFTLTAEAKDRFGNRVTSAGYAINFRAVQVPDSTKAASGALSVTNGSLAGGFFTGGSFRYNVAEPIRVEVTSAANPVKGYSSVVAVDNASAYRIVKLGGDSTGVHVGDSVRLRARVLDIYGNAVNAQTVFFTVQQGSGHLEASQAVTDANGAVSLLFWTDTIRGTNQVRASILDANPEGLETQSYTVTTVPRSTIASVTLALPGFSFQAGESFTGNVAAYDRYGNLIDTDSSSQLRCVARKASMIFVPGVMTLAAGRSSFSASDTTAGVNRIRVLSLGGDSLSDWSGPLTIHPAPAYRIVEVRGDTLGVPVGSKAGLRARVSDRYGNAVSSEIVRFVITSSLGGSPSLWDGTGAPGDGLVLTDATGAAVCSLTTDTHAGTNTVSASILDANPPALERVVFSVGTAAGTIARFDVLPDGYAKAAGQTFALQLIAYDLEGNEAADDDTSRVNLSSSGSAVFSVNPVTLTNGRAALTVRDTKAEKLVLRAQTLAGGALSSSDTITVRPEVPSGAITFFSIVPATITANGSSISTITTNPIHDAYGNVVASGTLVRVTPSLGSVGSEDKDPSTPLTVERQTESSGAVSVFIRSGTTPGLSSVQFQSLTGSASGAAGVTFAPPPACSYAGYLTPRQLVPTKAASFRISVANGAATGLNLGTQTSIFFADSASNVYEAHLASAVPLAGSATDTIDFESTVVPAGMIGGAYTPRIRLVGNDVYGAPYQVEFNAGSNGVSVSSVDIMRITAPSIVSRGDTFQVDVRIRNGGGLAVAVNDIVPSYGHGYFGVTGSWNPPLPDILAAGAERNYRRSMYVFANSPLGADTIDASVTATADGSQIQDFSADPNTAPIIVQSAASIAYVPGSLSPGVVSKGQSHGFSVSLRNDGQAAVILSGSGTWFSFTDGVDTLRVSLGADGALPGGRVTNIVFPPATVPLAMDAGSWSVSVRLRGTENGGSFGQTIVPGDPIVVVEPAHLAYRSGSVAPTPVSKRSAVAFEVGIDNAGGGTVVCDPDSTWITFSSGSIVYSAKLDGSRGASVAPGARTLYFNAVTIPDAMPTGKYRPTVRVKGFENGLAFSVNLVLSDSIAVQSPSQLAIASTAVIPSDSITADQAKNWFASIRLDNNGGAAVRLDSLSVRLYAGSREVTSECGLTPLNFNPRVDILNGGQGTNIVVRFEDNTGGPMTVGTIVVESTVWGRDMNSGAALVATTEFGGKGSYLVQTPANVAVVAIVPSADTVTAFQKKDWTIDAVLRNTGQSAVALNFNESNTYLTFSTSGDFLVLSPVALAGGGVVLDGGATDTLRYRVDRTGSVSGLCRIASTVRATEINSERALAISSGASGVYGDVLVQSEAALEIAGFAPLQDPVTIGQARDWTIRMEVRNTGESDATLLLDRVDSTWVAVPEGSGFSIENPAELPGGGRTLHGGSSVFLPFVVRTTGSIPPGRRVLAGAVLAAENNSGRKLHAERYAPSSVDSVSFELRPDPRYAAGSLSPVRVSSGASVAFEVRIASDASRRSTLVLDHEKVTFSFGDADGDTFRTTLSPVSEHILAKGGGIGLLFRDVPVDTAIAHVTLPVFLHLEGTENGNPFSADFAALDDSVSIEQAPQLSINRIVVPQSVTRSQSAAWPVYMVLRNNGEASVVVDLASAKTFINFNIVGFGDRTYEYGIDYPERFEGSRTDTLAGGSVDSLLFAIAPTGSTAGLALVNGKVTAVDINSGLTIFDDTYDGGFSHMAIQNPGAPAVAHTVPERNAVTSGQTTPWRITLEVCNAGEADLALVTDSTSVFYGNRMPLAFVAPAGFVEGGLSLEGGACKHLVFIVSPTPDIPAGADIALHAHAGFVESNSSVYRAFDTKLAGSGSGTVRIQAPAQIRITQVANKASRSPYVNINQRFPVLFNVINEGEAEAESIRVALEKSGSSAIDDTLLVLEALSGATSASDTFGIEAGTASGLETFRARIRGAVDGNSGESGLVHINPALDDTTRAIIQSLASLGISSVRPSQREVNAGQAADWTVSVSFANGGAAPLALRAPAAGDLAFSISGTKRFDYLVIAPDTLGSGSSVFSLAGGASDSLIYRVSSTGSDTGTVAIDASLGWADMNDPLRDPGTSGGSGSVHVKAPSGLRIVSVTSGAPNNARFPNTSVVDTAQMFSVTVRVENTGGDDLDSVDVRLVSNGATRTSVVGDRFVRVASKSEKDFVFSVVAASSPASEILTSSIVYAVSVNTGERVYPAQAAESIENLRIELPALLECGIAVTAPAGALDDTLSAGQTFVVTATVANQGQALVDTTGEMTLVLPASVRLANPAEPLVKRLRALNAVTWTLVAPATPSQDTVRARISGIPMDVNTAGPAAVRAIESRAALRTEEAARVSGCGIAITAPPGAVDGTLSTDQDLALRSVFVPSANADSVWIELAAPAGFSVIGDRTRFIGKGAGTPIPIEWVMRAPIGPIAADTIVVRTGGKDGNSGRAVGTCRVVLPVHVQIKPALSLSARISGPDEALDGSVSVSLPFTIEGTAAKSGEAAIDTTGARIELVLPAGQGYALGAQETYRKPFFAGQSVEWNVIAPAASTPPGNIEVRLVEPYATDVNTNLPCEISTGAAFIPVQTEAGSVLMSNISLGDTIPPYVVPQGARGVPVMRIVLRNASGFTIGLDTLYVAIEDGKGNLVASPARSVDSLSCSVNGSTFSAAAGGVNPVPIIVRHRFTLPPSTADTLLIGADIGSRAPAGEIGFEIVRSADVVLSITESSARIGVSLELDGGDIEGHFRSGPLSIMSSRFDEYVHNYPNPFRAGTEPTKICYFLKRNTAVTIKIYDLGGKLVWTKSIAAGDTGGTGTAEGIWHEIPWNGRNDGGELVRNGVYLCKVEAGSQSALFKIAVAK
jgi:hypothetical protein